MGLEVFRALCVLQPLGDFLPQERIERIPFVQVQTAPLNLALRTLVTEGDQITDGHVDSRSKMTK